MLMFIYNEFWDNDSAIVVVSLKTTVIVTSFNNHNKLHVKKKTAHISIYVCMLSLWNGVSACISELQLYFWRKELEQIMLTIQEY